MTPSRRISWIAAAALLAAACGDDSTPSTVPPTSPPTTSTTVPPTSTSRPITTTTTSPAEPGFVEGFERVLGPQLQADGVSAAQIRCAAKSTLTAVGLEALVFFGITPADIGPGFVVGDRIPSLRTPDAAQRAALLLADCQDASQATAARFALALNVGGGNPDELAACARTNLTPTQANALNAANLFEVPPGVDHDYDLLRYRINVEAGLVMQGLCGFKPIDVPIPTIGS